MNATPRKRGVLAAALAVAASLVDGAAGAVAPTGTGVATKRKRRHGYTWRDAVVRVIPSAEWHAKRVNHARRVRRALLRAGRSPKLAAQHARVLLAHARGGA